MGLSSDAGPGVKAAMILGAGAAAAAAAAAGAAVSLRWMQQRPSKSCNCASDGMHPENAPPPSSYVPTRNTCKEGDWQGVEKTTVRWAETVVLGTPDGPRETADLYAPDAVLWGTVSEEVRDTPEEIYDYFDYFARLPELRLSEFTPAAERVYGDFATQAGTYTFAWKGENGETQTKRARFSFAFRRDPGSPTGWTIVEHHSSSMPHSPDELKHVMHGGTVVF